MKSTLDWRYASWGGAVVAAISVAIIEITAWTLEQTTLQFLGGKLIKCQVIELSISKHTCSCLSTYHVGDTFVLYI